MDQFWTTRWLNDHIDFVQNVPGTRIFEEIIKDAKKIGMKRLEFPYLFFITLQSICKLLMYDFYLDCYWDKRMEEAINNLGYGTLIIKGPFDFFIDINR